MVTKTPFSSVFVSHRTYSQKTCSDALLYTSVALSFRVLVSLSRRRSPVRIWYGLPKIRRSEHCLWPVFVSRNTLSTPSGHNGDTNLPVGAPKVDSSPLPAYGPKLLVPLSDGALILWANAIDGLLEGDAAARELRRERASCVPPRPCCCSCYCSTWRGCLASGRQGTGARSGRRDERHRPLREVPSYGKRPGWD